MMFGKQAKNSIPKVAGFESTILLNKRTQSGNQ